MSKAISRRDFIKVTGAVGAAGLLALWPRAAVPLPAPLLLLPRQLLLLRPSAA